jgi:hypothetical protein
MTSALVYKEFRETLPIAVLGVGALLVYALTSMGYAPLPETIIQPGQGEIPFINDSLSGQLKMITGCVAIALGFWQSLGDFWGDAQLFLLHRPVSRQKIYFAKLLVGLATYAACSFVPVLLYAAWAAAPGTHASPFDWSMTNEAWNTCFGMTAIYLGAFLSGIRPAAWVGTRLAPLAAVGLTSFISSLLYWNEATGLAWFVYVLATDVVLIVAIFRVTSTRDFV